MNWFKSKHLKLTETQWNALKLYIKIQADLSAYGSHNIDTNDLKIHEQRLEKIIKELLVEKGDD